jgi:hypothetical protein
VIAVIVAESDDESHTVEIEVYMVASAAMQVTADFAGEPAVLD